jgi:hypothetical protein
LSQKRTQVRSTVNVNPYTAPAAELQANAEGQRGEVGHEVVELLARTKPWLRVVGVFMWIMVALMALGSVGILAVGTIGRDTMQKANPQLSGTLLAVLAGVYLLFAGLAIVPTRRIWSFGSAIERLTQSRRQTDLVAALDAQRSFWMFVGICLLLVAALYVLILVGAVVAGSGAPANGAAPAP